MTVTHRPRIRICTNGSAAVVDRSNDGGFAVVELPSGKVRVERSSYGDVWQVLLSASGRSVALVTSGAQAPGPSPRIEVLDERGAASTHALPRELTRVRAAAISDGGDRLALLVAAAGGAPSPGALELWALPPGSAPIAAVTVPVLDHGELTGDGALDVLAFATATTQGDVAHDGVYRKGGAALAALWGDSQGARFVTAACGGFVWAAERDGLTGRRGDEPAVRLPGPRSRFRFSPRCDHLLVHRVVARVDEEHERVALRVIDLGSLAEVASASADVAGAADAQFVLDAGLGIFEVRAGQGRRAVVKAVTPGAAR